MLTAALDTSVKPSFALCTEDEIVIQDSYRTSKKRSETILLPWIKDMLDSQDVTIDQIPRWLVGLGPGSFTGIRTGIALIKGFCSLSSRECHGIASSAALAWAAISRHHANAPVAVLHDGRRDQAILTKYENTTSGLQELAPPEVIQRSQIPERTTDCPTLITPHERFAEHLPDAVQDQLIILPNVEAGDLLSYFLTDPLQYHTFAAEHSEPIYVRPPAFVKPFSWK